MLAETAIAEVSVSIVGFLDFYSKSCLSGHDNIADVRVLIILPIGVVGSMKFVKLIMR